MAEWLGRLKLYSRVNGSIYSPDLFKKVRRENFPSLYNSRQKESRGVVTLRGKTRVALLRLGILPV